MKQIKMDSIEVEMKSSDGERRKVSSSPPQPPPLPPLPSYWMKPAVKSITIRSVTNEEIAKFWRQKKIDEENHLLAAIKAAARIRARNMTEKDYRQFESSLDDDNKEDKSTKDENNDESDINKEIRVGIKDWWTKSKYAYLNQPALDATAGPKRTSTYIPNFCFYKSPPTQHTSYGVY